MSPSYTSLDPYRSGEHSELSPVHLLDARVKLILAVALILTASVAPPGAWPIYILLLAVSISITLLADIGLRYLFSRAILALPFIFAALPLLITVEGTSLLKINIFGLDLSMTVEGLIRFASIALKSWISVQIAILLSATTRIPDILMAMRALRMPRLLVAVIGLMWRYLFLMIDEAGRLLRARFSRSSSHPSRAVKPGGPILWRARVAGNMAGNLLIRSFERSDRVYAAMLSRGYDGEVRGIKSNRLGKKDWTILSAALVFLVILSSLGI